MVHINKFLITTLEWKSSDLTHAVAIFGGTLCQSTYSNKIMDIVSFTWPLIGLLLLYLFNIYMLFLGNCFVRGVFKMSTHISWLARLLPCGWWENDAWNNATNNSFLGFWTIWQLPVTRGQSYCSSFTEKSNRASTCSFRWSSQVKYFLVTLACC